jgi:hypothetical protein
MLGVHGWRSVETAGYLDRPSGHRTGPTWRFNLSFDLESEQPPTNDGRSLGESCLRNFVVLLKVLGSWF